MHAALDNAWKIILGGELKSSAQISIFSESLSKIYAWFLFFSLVYADEDSLGFLHWIQIFMLHFYLFSEISEGIASSCEDLCLDSQTLIPPIHHNVWLICTCMAADDYCSHLWRPGHHKAFPPAVWNFIFTFQMTSFACLLLQDLYFQYTSHRR